MIAKIPFGRTGHNSSRLLFGAAAIGWTDQKESDRILDLLLKHGINHIDTAASYGDSELRIGPWMKRYRSEFFLATKTGKRTYDEAYTEIQHSLERLQTDVIDAIQLHNLVDPTEWATAFDDNGALKAALDARDKGYVRFIGVTGHGLSVAAQHTNSLESFPFDSVLTPYNHNFMNIPNYRADFDKLYAVCQEKQVALQTIKSIARGRWGDKPRTRTTWYEPLESQSDIDAAVAYVLARPGIFLNTAGDTELLPRVLQAAERFYDANPDQAAVEATLSAAALEPLFTVGDKI